MLKLEDVGDRAATTSRRSGSRRSPSSSAPALVGRTPEALQLSPPRDPSRTIMASAAPAAGTAAHGAILVLHDITELRRADQIRRDFVANVSHELRTPLTAIRGYVEALSEERYERRGQAAVPRHHRPPHAADGAPGQGPAAAGAARRRAGDARRHRRAIRGRSSQTVVSDLAPAAEERRQRIEVTIAPGAETVRAAIRPSCTMRCATWSPMPSRTRRRARRSGST